MITVTPSPAAAAIAEALHPLHPLQPVAMCCSAEHAERMVRIAASNAMLQVGQHHIALVAGAAS